MKILLSGYHNPHFWTITEYIEQAIRSLGHDLYIFDDRQHIIPGRIRRRVAWINAIDRGYINRKLLSLAWQKRPDVAIVTGGHRIAASTIGTLKKYGIKTVLWTIDAPLDFQPILDAASRYDHIYCQGTEAMELLERAGIHGAHWLPMACDPFQHKPVKLSAEEKKYYGKELVFVGSYYPNRAELFEELSDFDFGIWGPGWDKLGKKSKIRKCIKGAHTLPSEWLKIYSASKIVLVTHYQDPENRFSVYQASPKVFEAMACGAFVVCDRQRDVFDLFTDGKHLVGLDDSRDLVEKIKYFLEHEDQRLEIARQGREEVIHSHTYVNRLSKLLSEI
ncbi:MAG: glycosyltransferase [Deltaproteobacteria bacterium]|nr:glycosyltransferase [Deltaproteobacteria bacterium]